jgi:hypothetical protein
MGKYTRKVLEDRFIGIEAPLGRERLEEQHNGSILLRLKTPWSDVTAALRLSHSLLTTARCIQPCTARTYPQTLCARPIGNFRGRRSSTLVPGWSAPTWF